MIDATDTIETSRMLALPDELMLEVVKHLDQRRDLLNLCLTCHALEEVAMSKLYTNVQIDLPQNKNMSWNTGSGLPTFRPYAVKSMRTLAVRSGCVDLRDPVYNKRRRLSVAGSGTSYLSEMLASVPQGQLRSFSFFHTAPLTAKMMDVLATAHGEALKELRMYELEVSWKVGLPLPRNLKVLECRSIRDGASMARLMQANSSTLEVLRLGQEQDLVQRQEHATGRVINQTPQTMDFFNEHVKLQSIDNLQELALFGIDLSSFIPETVPNAMFFCQIESLTMESCRGSAEFLDAIANTFHHSHAVEASRRRFPVLKEFAFRHEAPTNHLKDCLIRFLSSFTGLEKLVLLFENAAFLESCSTLINEHGPSLKVLVLECRIQPRSHLGLDTSRPFSVGGYSQALWEESINEICRLCPNLVELGTGFPWDDEIVRIRKTNLPSLNQLRTVHVRNFPQSQFLSQIGDYAIREYANKFVEWNFPALVGGARPSLETLSIGPTLYESRWRSSTVRKQPPEFLRTHHFCLDWAQTRFGRWSAMITNVSEKCMEETVRRQLTKILSERLELFEDIATRLETVCSAAPLLRNGHTSAQASNTQQEGRPRPAELIDFSGSQPTKTTRATHARHECSSSRNAKTASPAPTTVERDPHDGLPESLANGHVQSHNSLQSLAHHGHSSPLRARLTTRAYARFRHDLAHPTDRPDLFRHTKMLCFAEYAQDKRFKWWRDNRNPFSPQCVPITTEHACIDPEALRTATKALRSGRDIWRCVKEAVEDIYAERIRPDAHEPGQYWDVSRGLWIIVEDVWIISVLLYGMLRGEVAQPHIWRFDTEVLGLSSRGWWCEAEGGHGEGYV